MKLWIKRSKVGKTEKSPKFAQNQLIETFSAFVPENFLKHYNELDEILRNFHSLCFSKFSTDFEKLEPEIAPEDVSHSTVLTTEQNINLFSRYSNHEHTRLRKERRLPVLYYSYYRKNNENRTRN